MPSYAVLPFTNGTRLLVGEDDAGVIFCHFCSHPERHADLIDAERRFFPDLKEVPPRRLAVHSLLTDYAAGGACDPSDYPVTFSRGTEFLRKVWGTLRETGRGRVISYKELARRAGYANAQQAVGQAMAKNYLLLFVPCHRVVAAGGGLGGFSAGLDKKKMLLKIEKISL
jgi:O-6-methylguanine DNA methyltransferase